MISKPLFRYRPQLPPIVCKTKCRERMAKEMRILLRQIQIVASSVKDTRLMMSFRELHASI